MKITILTYGSSGDVLPYVALALGLQQSGHDVMLGAPSNFERHITGYGLAYSPIFGDTQAILDSDTGKQWIASGNVKQFMKYLGKVSYDQRAGLRKDTMAACEGADIIIGGSMMIFYATTISEKLQIPLLLAFVNPVAVSTGAFPHFLVSAKPFPLKVLNRLSFGLFFKSYQKSVSGIMNEWRAELGLVPLKSSLYTAIAKLKVPIVFGYSAEFLPKPVDWSAHILVSGLWELDTKYKSPNQPDVALEKWIMAGEPPVYFGFGSMPVLNPAAMVETVAAVCREMDIRAVINAGWSQLNEVENKPGSAIYTINYANLEWLFPQCMAIVHHGGVGTTQIGLVAGIPAVICSVFADNAFWGERLEKLNAGRHIRYKDLSKDKIIHALKQLRDTGPKIQARLLGNKIKTETGLKNAVKFIENQAKTAPVYVTLN